MSEGNILYLQLIKLQRNFAFNLIWVFSWNLSLELNIKGKIARDCKTGVTGKLKDKLGVTD